METCADCTWWNTIDGSCLLGRDTANCDSSPARRGDKELVDRILRLPKEQREMLASRFDAGASADEDDGDQA